MDAHLPPLIARLPAAPLTRFAPAPTGWLHLGHVLNAHYVWTLARAVEGRVLLRIEDHDRTRSRPEFEAGILDDLDWLGFHPDIYPTDAFRAGRCEGRQSDRDGVYQEALDILRARRLVYACDCSRTSVRPGVSGWTRETGLSAAALSDGEGRVHAGRNSGPGFGGHSSHSQGTAEAGPSSFRRTDHGRRPDPVELHYAGRCRDRQLPLVDGYGWRVRMEPGVEVFDDALLGEQRQDPSEQCGDVLLRDRHGNWTYQFAVTVDDWRQKIDLVIRGTDLLASTARQIRLGRLLGRPRPPVFFHHPLIMKTPDQKLSKSDGDTGVRDLRARGWGSADVIEAAVKKC
jgi:glutamyl-tRNA synthetase/glutamyl-Q tRNA(Asp) synthetase